MAVFSHRDLQIWLSEAELEPECDALFDFVVGRNQV